MSEAETDVLAALALVLLMSRGAALRQAPPLLRAVKRYWEPPRGAGEALSLGCMMWGALLFVKNSSSGTAIQGN